MARQVGSTRGRDIVFSYIDILDCRTNYAATIVFAALGLVFPGILYYKNVSFVIMKRLLREPNVVIILAFRLCN